MLLWNDDSSAFRICRESFGGSGLSVVRGVQQLLGAPIQSRCAHLTIHQVGYIYEKVYCCVQQPFTSNITLTECAVVIRVLRGG